MEQQQSSAKIQQEVKEKIVQTRLQLMARSSYKKQQPIFKQVAAEVRGQDTKLLKDSPDQEDNDLQNAKKKFRSRWKIEQAFGSNDIIVPTDSPTLKLLYGDEKNRKLSNSSSKSNLLRTPFSEKPKSIDFYPGYENILPITPGVNPKRYKYEKIVYGKINASFGHTKNTRINSEIISRIKSHLSEAKKLQSSTKNQIISENQNLIYEKPIVLENTKSIKIETNLVAKNYEKSAHKLSPKFQNNNNMFGTKIQTKLKFDNENTGFEPDSLKNNDILVAEKSSVSFNKTHNQNENMQKFVIKIHEISEKKIYQNKNFGLLKLLENLSQKYIKEHEISIILLKNFCMGKMQKLWLDFKQNIINSKNTDIQNIEKKAYATMMFAKILQNNFTNKIRSILVSKLGLNLIKSHENSLQNTNVNIKTKKEEFSEKIAKFIENHENSKTAKIPIKNNEKIVSAKCMALIFNNWKLRILHEFIEKCKLFISESNSQKLKAKMFAGLISKVLKNDKKLLRAIQKWRLAREIRIASICKQISEKLKSKI